MIRRRFLILGAILAGIAMTGLAPPARADYELTLTQGSASITLDYNGSTLAVATVDGATYYAANETTVPGVGESLSVTASVGTYLLDVSATLSNAITGSLPAKLSVNSQVEAIGGSGTSSLTITASDGGFTAPTTPFGAMTTGVSAVNILGLSDSETDVSQLGATVGTTLSLGAGDTAATPVTNTVPIPGSPYTLQNTLTITGAAGDTLQGQATTDVSPVPVPAGMVLGLSGMPVLCLGYLLRRRQVRPMAAA
jgi:hypothetical protein